MLEDLKNQVEKELGMEREKNNADIPGSHFGKVGGNMVKKMIEHEQKSMIGKE